MDSVIELRDVTKMYGSNLGVKDINLEVPKGSVFGFLGPNGSGKTTTINMLVDLIRPTEGRITVFGLDNNKNSIKIRQQIGYLGGDIAMDRALTGWQQLEYFGYLRGSFDKKLVTELAERLDCNLNRKFKTLSRGNKQKVGLIAALMSKPELLILDEPTSGLDPLAQAEFNKIILEFQGQGKTAFISSHILSEVQEICDHVAFIRRGQIIENRTMEELSANLPKEVVITSNDSALLAALEEFPGFNKWDQKNDQIIGAYTGSINWLLSLLAKYKIDNLNMHDADLETIFMKYYESSPDDIQSSGETKDNKNV